MRESKTIKIHAVGDIMLGDLPPNYGFGIGSLIYKHGPRFPFELCAEKLRDADIVFGNLEVVLSAFDRNSNQIDTTILRGQPEAVEGLQYAGINIVSLANNHIMQHGLKALEETIRSLEMAGIKYTGLSIPAINVANRAVFDVCGKSLCFLGYNQRPQQYYIDNPVYVEAKLEKIISDISQARKESDIVVVSIHWGEEFIDCPAPWQIDMAHTIVDSGADIILGHHSHTVQGIEMYKGKPIAYSLGNFIFDMWQKRLRKTFILELNITDGVDISCKVIPVEINNCFQPMLLDSERAKSADKDIALLSSKITHRLNVSEYETKVKAELKRYRKEIYMRYLTSLFRYKPSFFYRNAIGIIKRRLK